MTEAVNTFSEREEEEEKATEDEVSSYKFQLMAPTGVGVKDWGRRRWNGKRQ